MLEVQRVTEQHTDKLISQPGVTGVGVGHKWVNGVPSTTPAVLVFVEKKRSNKNVTQKFGLGDIIPSEIDGIPTDVIEVGKIVKQAFTQRVRPIKPGFSCGQRDITAGTMGGFFLDADNEPVILSNNHVLANENRAKIDDPIYQPGPYDSSGNLNFVGWNDPVASLPYVGTLKKFAELQAGAANKHDSAIARIHSKVAAGLVDSLYPTLNRPCSGFGVAKSGTQVQKCGRTTGYTTGRIIGTNATFTIQYDIGKLTFTDCVVASNMSKGGDSGSLILDMDMKAVALLFAGSRKVTIANPIGPVVDYYGLKLWNPNGAVGIDTLDFGDKTWHTVSSGGTITNDGRTVTINGAANKYAYLESPIQDFASISVTVNTGSDAGATWGPSLTAVWPTGTLKVNLRHGDRFGGYFNGTYNISMGQVKPNTDYELRIRKSSTMTWIGEVNDHGRWHTVIELPASIFPHSPVAIRVGKNDIAGNPADHTDAGPTGTCTFRDLQQS